MFPYLKKLGALQVSLRTGALLGLGLLGLFGLMEAGAWELRHVRLRSRVQHVLPRLRQETARQLHLLASAIDDYKTKLGCYPPDHLLSQNPPLVDTVTNQLLYELFGTIYDSTNDTFSPKGHFPSIRGSLVKRFFNVDSFRNSGKLASQVTQFLQSGDIQSTLGVSQKPDVGVLAFFPEWEGIDPDLLQEFELAPWHYNSSAPVHNPKAYDLWIEIPVSGTRIVVGNWQ